MAGRQRSGAELADEVLKPEVQAMLDGAQAPDQVVFALLMVAYDVFRADMRSRPALARAAMFLELSRGTAMGMEKLPRDARLPKVRQLWPDNLGENGAAIRMRSGSRNAS